MQLKDTRTWYITVLIGCLFVLDQTYKYLAQTNQTKSWYLIDKIIGWEFFANPGIAFGINFPLIPLLVITPLILWFFFHTQKNTTMQSRIGFIIICAGVISNTIDRIVHGYVVDYLRVFTGVFNLADVYIIIGVIILFYEQRKK